MSAILIGITGTPGSGKSTFARRLKSKAGNIDVREINEIAKKYNAYSGMDEDGTIIADMKKLNAAVRKELAALQGRSAAIVGHMMQELSIKPDVCITIRTKPSILYKRQRARGYPLDKIKENIISEALDYCGEGARAICRSSLEVETKAEKDLALEYLAALASGNAKKCKKLKDKTKAITAGKDMMADFLKFIRKSNIGF